MMGSLLALSVFIIRCFLFFNGAVFSSCQTTATTETKISSTTIGGGSSSSSDVDKERLLATARLHDLIRRHPVVEQRVAPVVTTSVSGEVKVDVNVSVSVGSVLSLHDADQTMTCSMYITVEWRDVSLAWDPGDFVGVSQTEMSPQSVWIPTLILINSRDPVDIMKYVSNLLVFSNGTARALIYYKTVTLCTMDHSHYPYDTQRCGFILESPSDCCRLNLRFGLMGHSDSARLIVKSDWELVSAEGEWLSDEVGRFSSMQLQLRRRTVYFTVCLVLPMVVTSYMNSLVFLLPVQCGEKVSFLVSLFVSTSIFISFFQEMMPRGLSTVPTTMKLLLGVLAESLLVLLATLLVLGRHHAQDEAADTPLPSTPLTTTSTSPHGVPPISRRDSVPEVMDGRGELQPRASASSLTLTLTPVKGSDPLSGKTATGSQQQQQVYWDAHRLDRLFFLVAFILNSVFLVVLVFE
ncbi:acetylcholine receptor subunit beta-type lev-1-like [Babylonia areolata]|uniref:acetylcholine receptor subunit beta-type lev-1-like n=1 Tax=Babylonia areolata TaxID=304850 RepID=UPI003FD57542